MCLHYILLKVALNPVFEDHAPSAEFKRSNRASRNQVRTDKGGEDPNGDSSESLYQLFIGL